MNRREAITAAAGLAIGTILPEAKLESKIEKDPMRWKTLKERFPDRDTISRIALIHNDPDVEQIETTILLKKGKSIVGSDSYILERAILQHVGTTLMPWFEHCRDTGLKTL